MVLKYKNGINIFEGSWDLPRSFQDLEIFGSTTGPDGNLTRGSIYMTQQKVELRSGRETRELPLTALPPEKADPISFMVDAIRNNKPIEGITAEALATRIRDVSGKNVRYGTSFSDVADAVSSEAEPGDMILTLGAGSVSHLGPLILERLQARQPMASNASV